MKSNYNRLGNYIREVNSRNDKGITETLLGINIDKYFMPSVANVVGTDLTKYKIVKEGQFACNLMHVGRDKRLPVAFSTKKESFLVSPAYDVFEIKNEDILNTEYLMMWFSRKEFDRNAWFYTDADVRGGLHWDAFCEMELPVPSIEKQKEIVAEYNTIVNRVKLNEKLNQKLEETAQAIYKQWFVDFEFPDENGKPYKSCGGEMIFNDVLDKEIPTIWNTGTLLDILELQRGFDLPTHKRENGTYPIYASSGPADFHSTYKVKAPGVVTGRSGSLGDVFYVRKDFWPLNTTLWVKNFNNSEPSFAYFTLKSINLFDFNGGSAVPTLNRNHVHMIDMCIPKMSTISQFEEICSTVFKHKDLATNSLELLCNFKNVLLAKMTKGI